MRQSTRFLTFGLLTAVAAMAGAQTQYNPPSLDFYLVPSATNVPQSTTFTIDAFVKVDPSYTGTDTQVLSGGNIILQWDASLVSAPTSVVAYAPGNYSLFPGYATVPGFTNAGQWGFTYGADGGHPFGQDFVFGFTPQKIMTFTFNSLTTNGLAHFNSPLTLGSAAAAIAYFSDSSNSFASFTSTPPLATAGTDVRIGAVPEPASMLALALGAGTLILRRRKG